MSKAKLFVMCIGYSIPCSIAAMLYRIEGIPIELRGVLWCMFAGYCTTYLFGASMKNFPKVVASYAVGVGWAFAYWYFYVLILMLGISHAATMFIDVLVITIIIMYVHLTVLKNTWVGKIALLFPPVFALFASAADINVYKWMIASLVFGAFTAAITEPFTEIFTNLFFKKEKVMES